MQEQAQERARAREHYLNISPTACNLHNPAANRYKELTHCHLLLPLPPLPRRPQNPYNNHRPSMQPEPQEGGEGGEGGGPEGGEGEGPEGGEGEGEEEVGTWLRTA